MYVARTGGRHVLKRMPGSGARHDFDCESYEPPPGLSGLGDIEGDAIVESAENGVTLLSLDFALTKLAGRTAPEGRETFDAGAVKTDGARLSLRALLHYLWDQAEFNRWRPAMTGKRNWAVIRKYLLEAVEGKIAKGKPLADMLYIPEMFDISREAAIRQRHIGVLESRHSLEWEAADAGDADRRGERDHRSTLWLQDDCQAPAGLPVHARRGRASADEHGIRCGDWVMERDIGIASRRGRDFRYRPGRHRID